MMKDNKLTEKEQAQYNYYLSKANELVADKLAPGDQLKELNVVEKIQLCEAIALFKECLKIDANAWKCMWAIGLSYFLLGENEDSAVWLNEAKKINPSIINEMRQKQGGQ
jgi:tetratricopeptide (TPR) repeat protein